MELHRWVSAVVLGLSAAMLSVWRVPAVANEHLRPESGSGSLLLQKEQPSGFTTAAAAVCRMQASVLTHITNINWLQGSSRDRAVGEMLGRDSRVDVFDLSASELGPAAVTARLWDLLPE